ncbi:hypothetical protein K9B35_17075 [Sphingomonas sp. R647]|uniref:hypothetical protein n=1 Tax=Sphingomonas sp. R647 TaxID=2875233 RepID=UPI001CD7775B|nr:hypothetical protein [Sphingomonas sp. R647]MCA1199682.1 hypothetical protein [Sphingomonas sp. R647]
MRSHALDVTSEVPVRAGWRGTFRNRWVRGAAALAVLAFGVFITLSIWAEPGSPVVVDGSKLVASSRLHQVLNDPSLATREGNPSIGARFTDKSGHSCHPFAQGTVNGTVCQIEGDWRVTEVRQR